MHPGLLHRRFLTDLSSSLFSFVLPLLPTQEERAVKEEYVGGLHRSSIAAYRALFLVPVLLVGLNSY
jgi:terminal uridylyltransferase